jgi:hypothetical protein
MCGLFCTMDCFGLSLCIQTIIGWNLFSHFIPFQPLPLAGQTGMDGLGMHPVKNVCVCVCVC